MEIRFFGNYVNNFISTQTTKVRGSIYRALKRLETYGYDLAMPDSRYLGEKLFELRITGTTHVRVFYTFKNDKAILLHAFIKKSNKTPKKDLEIARKRQSALASV